ncbi:MAG: hypothetical protein AABO41_24880 [Acidobacteriota bacterium]
MSNKSSLAFVIASSVAAANFLSPIDVMAFVADEMSYEDAAKLLHSHEMFSAVQTITL